MRQPESAETVGLNDLYRTMARIRAFEERVGAHFRGGDIHGFVHVSSGQEAVAAGACSGIQQSDLITTTHRGHGHCIAKALIQRACSPNSSAGPVAFARDVGGPCT